MKHALARFYQFLDRPITWWSRIVLVVLVVPLLLFPTVAAGVGLMARAALQVLLGVAATGDGLADMA